MWFVWYAISHHFNEHCSDDWPEMHKSRARFERHWCHVKYVSMSYTILWDLVPPNRCCDLPPSAGGSSLIFPRKTSWICVFAVLNNLLYSQSHWPNFMPLTQFSLLTTHLFHTSRKLHSLCCSSPHVLLVSVLCDVCLFIFQWNKWWMF